LTPEKSSRAFVPFNISRDFPLPEDAIGLRKSTARAAGVMMPEAAVYEDHCLETGQYQIGCAGKILALQAKPVSLRMQESSGKDFGLGVLLSDTAHHPASLRLGEDVRHVF
jgi:hypothetical protein